MHEIVSSVIEEPKGKGKGSKSPRPSKVQASPTTAPVMLALEPKSAKNKKPQAPIPQDSAANQKKTKSPAPTKVISDPQLSVDVVMTDATAQPTATSAIRKKKQQLEESKTVKTSASAKKLKEMPSLLDQASTQKKRIAKILSNSYFVINSLS